MKRAVATVWLLMVTLGIVPIALGRHSGPDIAIYAILLGSGYYLGTSQLTPLQYADDDAVRVMRTLQAFSNVGSVQLLVEPDPALEQELLLLGRRSWQPPTSAALRQAFRELQQELEQAPTDQLAHVLFFVSAHGEASGFHLADGIFSGIEVQYLLGRLKADHITVIADSCFSSAWLGQKGVAPPDATVEDLPVDRFSQELQKVPRLGSVTSQSFTREDQSSIYGGLMTHVVASVITGGADLDNDGNILYSEVDGYLTSYLPQRLYQKNLGSRIVVRTPLSQNGRPPPLISSQQLRRSGIRFEPRFAASSLQHMDCFWIRTTTGRWVSEFCKPLADYREVYLPPGVYNVLRHTPPDAWLGEEDQVTVASGLTSVADQTLTGLWIRLFADRGEDATAPPPTARKLTPQEEAHVASTPFQWLVADQHFPDYQQRVIRWEASTPLDLATTSDSRIESTGQENRSYWLSYGLDWRHHLYRKNRTLTGFDLALGASFRTEVAGDPDTLVSLLRLRGRKGYERSFDHMRLHFVGTGGLFTAIPFNLLDANPDGSWKLPPSNNVVQEPVVPLNYVVGLGGVLGLEVSAQYRLPRSNVVEMGVTFQWAFEPDLSQTFRETQYPALTTWIAIRK